MSNLFKYKKAAIRYTSSGKGPVVVLLHGFLENLTMWSDIEKALSESSRVVSIDLLGHGKSGNLGYIHTMEEQAEMIRAVLKHLKLRRYTLIGHSMGGYIALAFAEQFSESIKGLCLMNSTPAADSNEKKRNRDRAIQVTKTNHPLFIKNAIPNLFSPDNKDRFKKEIDQLIEDAMSLSPQGIIASLEGMKIRRSRIHVLANKGYKKMMIIGQKDPVLPYKALKNNVKNTRTILVEFPDGHMSHIENQEELRSILKDFVKSCN